MNRKTIAIITACVMALSFAGCSKKKPKPPVSTATNVTVQKVDFSDIENTVDYTGEIKAGDTSSVSVMVSAEVKEINVEIGDYVNAGDVLMTLDTAQYQLAYDQAQAAYSQAQAGYTQAVAGVNQAVAGASQAQAAYNQAQASKETTIAAKDSAEASYNNVTGGSLEQSRLNASQAVTTAQSAYDTALSNYNRQKALFDIGAISQVALDTAKTNLDNAQTALDTAKANAQITEDVVVPQTSASAQAGVNQAQAGVNQADAGIQQAQAGIDQANAGVAQAQAGITQAQAGIQQAKVAMDSASTNLQNCVVTAPISGYITAKNITLGQMASPGYEIFQIKNSEMVDVEINVTESVITLISPGTKALINIDSANIDDVEGVVTAVAAAKNDATGMFAVKVAIPNKGDKIKVGMISEVSLVTQSVTKVLAIDFNAILKDGDINYVYVAEDGKAVRKDVVIGISNGKKAEILSGLEKGDKVIVEGKEFLSEENNKVKIVK